MDYTLCFNYEQCPKRKECFRASKTSSQYQSIAMFYNPDKECEHFIPNDELCVKIRKAMGLYDPKDPEKTIAQILEVIKPPVEIIDNTETGERLFSVAVLTTDLWLDSFQSYEEAVDFAKKHDLFL